MPAPPRNQRGSRGVAVAGEPPTWLTCDKSSLRLAGPSLARPPWGSDYLRRLTHGEVETLGDREGRPAAPWDF